MKRKKLIAAVLLCAVFSCSLSPLPGAGLTVQAGTGKGTESRTYPDTVRWFNSAYALWCVRNGADISKPGGGSPNDLVYSVALRQILERDWGVTDRRSAEDKITWLETEGHNKALLSYYKEHNLGQYATDIDLNASWGDNGSQNSISDGEAARQMAAYMAYKTYGENACAGWDLSRALMLLGQYYVTGYYTYEEAMDKSLEIAKKAQTMFPSWEDFMQSYIYGYVFWSKSDPTDPQSEFQYRVYLYQSLKAMEDGPYQLDWYTELKKEW